ncbi:hypothetical protein [Actinomadura roseirufa]|uniref:hypothetical protein n=1 Tax=Actinomadura roseirufa TaxID=2094049 RepID=UPI001F5E3F51|nr:hypothetical protein [Actinomadura roseirufa]
MIGRQVIGRRAGRVPAAVAAGLLVLTLPGCKLMRRISDGSFNNAVTDGTVLELKNRGVRLEKRPSCKTPDSGSASVVHVRCTARTLAGEPVAVRGVATAANTDHPRESYVITVGRRVVLRQNCLGLGCH